MAELSVLARRVRRAINSLGWDLIRYRPETHPQAKLASQLRAREIDVVLDVGANTGQYARRLRELGYRGVIHSFEPLGDASRLLCERATRDPAWEAHRIALGSSDASREIQVTANSASSSLLDTTDLLTSRHPGCRTVGSESTDVRRLDSLFPDLCGEGSRVFLKIDTQGYEKEVLVGAERCLPRVEMIQLEMSFATLYSDQPLFDELYGWLSSRGFRLSCLDGGWWDASSGDMMQVDGLFHRPLSAA